MRNEVPLSARHEETMLWLGAAPEAAAPTDTGEGADEMEVIGGSPTRPPATGLPGSVELDEAMAALDAIAGRSPAHPAEPESPSAPEPEPEPAPKLEPAPPPASSPAWPMADRSAASAPAISSPPKVVDSRLTSTPASRAYRRLRRIFPG